MDKYKNKNTNNKNNSQATLFSLSDFGKKNVEVEFTTEQISSDGGLLFLKEIDNNIGLIDRMVSCIVDNRHQSYVIHGTKNLLNQRIMQIASGYEDANDCNSLRDDGVLKVCCDSENSLSSQPIMSRFEATKKNVKRYHSIENP